MSLPLLPILLIGGGVVALVALSPSSSKAAASPPTSPPAPGKLVWRGSMLIPIKQCTDALAAMPPAMVDKLVKSDLSDLIELGDQADKLGLTQAAQCLRATAARTRIDALAEDCYVALLGLPANVLKATAASIRSAASADDLRAVASSLDAGGYKDAAACIRARADKVDMHFKDVEKILGRKLVSTGICDQRLFELPEASFKKILQAVNESDPSELHKLAKGLNELGFKDSAACIEERAVAMEKGVPAPAPVSMPGLGGSRLLGPGAPSGDRAIAPAPLDLLDLRRNPGGLVKQAVAVADEFLIYAGGDILDGVPDEFKKEVGGVLERLRAFAGNLPASGYTVSELLQLADLLNAAPRAAKIIKDAADEINMLRNWPLITKDKSYFAAAKEILSGMRRIQDDSDGLTYAESATPRSPSAEMYRDDVAALRDMAIGAGDGGPGSASSRISGFIVDIDNGRVRSRVDF